MHISQLIAALAALLWLTVLGASNGFADDTPAADAVVAEDAGSTLPIAYVPPVLAAPGPAAPQYRRWPYRPAWSAAQPPNDPRWQGALGYRWSQPWGPLAWQGQYQRQYQQPYATPRSPWSPPWAYGPSPYGWGRQYGANVNPPAYRAAPRAPRLANRTPRRTYRAVALE